MTKKTEQAIFGAGCFWGVEETFRTLQGVVSTEVGYSGGRLKNPTYEQVCKGNSGHVEVVRITFDSGMISYETLLGIFWSSHDPTTVNRQGPDVGEQYRSVVFYLTPAQKEMAEHMKAAFNQSKRRQNPIMTGIELAKEFYSAEEYHQKYLSRRGIRRCH